MSDSTRLLIIKLGDTLPHLRQTHGDFEDWIANGLRASGLPLTVSVLDPRAGDVLPSPARRHSTRAFDGVVVTGSHAMVTDREGWSEHTACWLRDTVAANLPVLGICYGHQLLAHALGGEVHNHPEGLEVGVTDIWRTPEADEDMLLAELPSHWPAAVSHRQSVKALPPSAVLLAYNRFEPHHAYRVGRLAWGVQFHPEFHEAASTAYITHLARDLEAQGDSPEWLRRQVQPTPHAHGLLARFAAIAHEVAQPAHAG